MFRKPVYKSKHSIQSKDIYKQAYKKLYMNIPDVYRSLLMPEENEWVLIQGGRGGAKTYSSAFITLLLCLTTHCKNSCVYILRNYQKSIEVSSYAIFKKIIIENNLENIFIIQSRSIKIPHINCEIKFFGMQNPASLKSIVDASIVVTDECEELTHKLTLLYIFRSIRRFDENNERVPILRLFLLNPYKPQDAIKSFIQEQKNHKIMHINIFDLPEKYQNKGLLQQAEDAKKADPDLYTWEWLGKPHPEIPKEPFKDIVFKDELDDIQQEGEVYAFIDPSFTGHDYTAIAIGWYYNSKLYITGYVYKLAWNQCLDSLYKNIKNLSVDYVYYESNGVGSSLEEIFYEKHKIRAEGRPTTSSSGSKVARIYNNISPIIEYIEFINLDNQFCKQIINFDMDLSKSNKIYDDAPDAVASLIKIMG